MRLPSIRSALPWLIGFSLIASLACLGLAVWLGLAAQTNAVNRATSQMAVEANTLARQIDSDLALFDLTLREVARMPARHDPGPRSALLELPLTAQYVWFMNVLNEAGDVIADPRSNVSRPANFAGRDYFQDQLKNPVDSVLIGRPFGIAPGQHAAIPISRRLTVPDGGFAGVVVAGVRLSWLSDLLSRAPPGPALTIRRDDGLILMRSPYDADAIGRTGAADPAWADYLRAGRSLAGDDADGLHLFRRVGASSLVLELTLSHAAITTLERAWLIWLPPLALIPGLCVFWLSLFARRLDHRARQTDAVARYANEDNMRVLATMSHELRTPLTGILGQVELLKDEGGLSEHQAMRLARLTEAGTMMRIIVNRVIDVARPGDHDATSALAPCDLDQLVRACAGMVESEARKKGLRLSTLIDPAAQTRPVLARDLVQQVLVNLLMNAVKFTFEGEVALRVMRTVSGVRFEVTDTGPGIPAGKRRRLFRAYDRLDAVDSRSEGTGLGLSITERFVHRMGGRIGHAENPGGGSIFWVELPEFAAETPAPTIEAPREEPEPVTRALRILLADDLDLTRSVTADYLRSAGHAVTEVPNGETAIEAARARDYDVILTDMRMPIMDGLEATRRIRALPGPRGRTPVVLVTADLVALRQGATGQADVDLCLMKPFTRAELLSAVESAARLGPEPPAGPLGQPVVDAALFAEMSARLGGATFAGHLGAATRRVEDLVALLEQPGAAENPTVADAVHDLIGISGILGLTGLSSCLRQFEIAKDRPTWVGPLREAGIAAVLAMRHEQETIAA